MTKKIVFLLLVAVSLNAQDFGFGFGDDGSFGGNSLSVSIGGEVSAEVNVFFDDFSDGADNFRLGDLFSGKLNFSAETAYAKGVINLKLEPSEQPVSIDEAYVGAFFGPFEIEAGLRKLTWGKADSFGPLDVINPLDYSELTGLGDMMNLKIARPLIRASYRLDSFSKIEGVFVPWFEGLRFDTEGRWIPAQLQQLDLLQALGVPVFRPDTSTIDYAQGGVRFTTTLGPADLGFQYYYGRLTRPAVTMELSPPSPVPAAAHFAYNPYHHIGIDWAQVLFGFNIRAEAAANITSDLKGDDGSVYNPSLLWSLGFDRDILWGINLNLQCNETIRLMHSKIDSNSFLDIEADTDVTSTQVTAVLSKKFLRDEFEARAVVLWEIEEKDFFIMPTICWTRDTVSIELGAGIFGGNDEGQFGSYRDNSFVKISMTYCF